ncbi:hypothetical protein SAMN05428971_3038 [Candidatus Pantoea varia]|uniref:Uncharacterized protein n=1 Tax=Candidatus Pantoea varia TaxID=1881036 RepID=A0A1I5ENV1_9GAMM|nr:hypothetical protein SAMN05428971_3038 [Pantoea varia]
MTFLMWSSTVLLNKKETTDSQKNPFKWLSAICNASFSRQCERELGRYQETARDNARHQP